MISARICEASRDRSRRSRIPCRIADLKWSRKPVWLPRQVRTTLQRAGRASRRMQGAAMFELIICSLVTILPDYLYRRYAQNKRFGKEITFYSVWYELRWGIVGCLMLTISLITTIFYFHPSTTSATLFFRTVPILPEASGRVAEVSVGFSAAGSKGGVIFRLDSSKQDAALETAKRKIAEVD